MEQPTQFSSQRELNLRLERGTKIQKLLGLYQGFSEEKPSHQFIPPESWANWKNVETNRFGACPVPRLPKSFKLLLGHGASHVV